MKAKREYADYLRDILDAARKARRFVEGLDFDAFVTDDEKKMLADLEKGISDQKGARR